MKLHSASSKVAVASAALIAVFGLAGVAQAQAQGLYIGGSVGGSQYKGNAVGNASTDRSDTGAKLYGGYRITPNIAVEAGYADLGKFDSSAGGLKGSGAYVDAVGKLPLAGPWSAIGRVGVFNGKTEGLGGNGHDVNAKYGAGLEYALDTNLSIRGEWERYRLDPGTGKANTDLYSVGVNYAF